MKSWIKSFIIATVVTIALVGATWMYYVYIEHWNPANMSLVWSDVFMYQIIIWVVTRIAMAIRKKVKNNKKVKYITMTLN